MLLANRVALVTGAARGLGLAMSRRLCAEGARVAVGARDPAKATHAACSLGGQALGVELDVTDPFAAQRAVDEVLQAWGRLDILVNNAAILGPTAPLWEVSITDWSAVINTDLTGVFVCCRAALPTMLAAGYGRIVNISSMAGKDGNPNSSAYSAAKAGVIGLTKSLGKELAQRGVLVNCVVPAVIESDMNRAGPVDQLELLLSKIPMGRMGRPEELAALVTWLCSEECSFSTGAVYDLSGGRATY